MFSIIIPLYNKETYISRSIQSVLQQSYSNFELIIVNDGSTDNSQSIVESIDDNRIRLINQKNAGVSAARNRGVKESKFEFVAFLDADDYWLPNHLEVLANLIADFQAEASVFSTNFSRIFKEKTTQLNRNDLYRGIVTNYFKATKKLSLTHSSCICIQKNLFLDVGGFDTRFSMGEDIDLWKKLARRSLFAYSPEVTSHYVIGAENNSASGKIDYNKDAARVALKVKFANFYDLRSSLRQYLKYLIKRAINHKPSVKMRKS